MQMVKQISPRFLQLKRELNRLWSDAKALRAGFRAIRSALP
jgi:hypothetical protein